MYYLKQPQLGTFSDLSSHFEAALIPLSSPEELKCAQEQFKVQFPKADHYPYAFRFEGLSRSSDDGEPSGTGGRALLSLLEQHELDRCLLMVARYFGGTKLGIPRLRRAFVAAGEDAIGKASLYIRKECYAYRLEISYSLYASLEKNQSRYQYELKDTSFDVNVSTTLYCFDRIDDVWEKLGISKEILPSPNITLTLMEANL